MKNFSIIIYFDVNFSKEENFFSQAFSSWSFMLNSGLNKNTALHIWDLFKK